MLKLQELIKTLVAQGLDWEGILSSAPYSLNIKHDGDYVLFSYNMIESDFSLQVVCEARGIIFYAPTWDVVCYPFNKFFNVQEGNAAEIDWNSARVYEKIDGSIIKLWFHNDTWHVSTNGTIDAANASLQTPADFGIMKCENYFDLFVYAASKYNFLALMERLPKKYTYIFELVSPFNRVVVPYTDTKIYHIGTRNNETLEELDVYIGIEQPVKYGIHYLEGALKAAEMLPFSSEGYVVVDKNWNRVKIKSPAYVAAHHLKNNGVITYERILDLIRANGQDDFVSVYPEYKNMVYAVLENVDLFLRAAKRAYANVPAVENRKQLAEYARSTIAPAAIFSVVDGKAENVDEWFWNQSNERILKMIGVAG